MTSSKDQRQGPLAGIRVLDWTHVLAGPQAAFQLAALGADVIRLENPKAKDIVRFKAADPALAELGLGEGFCMLGAGRRTVAVDASTPLGRKAIADLIAQSDVVLENFRPGKLAALGFSPERLIELHPNLVVCSITGYPSEDPRAQRPAYDHVIQAASGLMAANADAQGKPRRVGFPLVDYAVGMHAASAVVAALYRKLAQQTRQEQRLRGEWLKLSMLETASMLLTTTYAAQAISGITPQRSSSTAYSGSALSGTFDTQTSPIALVCNNPTQARQLLQALRSMPIEPQLIQALRESSQAQDVVATQTHLQSIFRSQTAETWDALLAAYDVPCAKLAQPFEAFSQLEPAFSVKVGVAEHAKKASLRSTGYASTESLHGALREPVPVGWDTVAVLLDAGWLRADIDAALSLGAVMQHPLGVRDEAREFALER